MRQTLIQAVIFDSKAKVILVISAHKLLKTLDLLLDIVTFGKISETVVDLSPHAKGLSVMSLDSLFVGVKFSRWSSIPKMLVGGGLDYEVSGNLPVINEGTRGHLRQGLIRVINSATARNDERYCLGRTGDISDAIDL